MSRSILLMAYQISPSRGSEYSVGWNFTINLAKKNKVYLFCGASGDHMGDTKEIEKYFKENPNANINLIPIAPTVLMNKINYLNKSGILPPAFYIAYKLWHKKAFKIAKSLIETEDIDIIHLLNPIGFREPGYLWKLDKPFVWGPIGGAKFIKLNFVKNIPTIHKFLFLLKNKINHIQLSYSKRVHKAAEKSSDLVFCNSEMKDAFENYLGKTGQIISEQGANTFSELIHEKAIESNHFNLVWAGNIRYIKNLPLLFKILSLTKDKSKWKLHLIGGGEKITEIKAIALKLNVYENIIWYDRKPRSETIGIMKQCDLHVLTSLSEGNPAVLYEAISLGVPTVSLDQDGMHNTLSNGNGILIPVTTYEETIKVYAKKIDELILNPKLLLELKERTILLANEVSWEKKIIQFETIYEKAINNYKNE